MGVRFVFSPKWFYGLDCIFEIFSVIVLLLLALSTYKMYRFTKEKHHLYLGASFIALALGFVAKILTNVEIYYPEAIINTLSPDVVFTITGIVHSSIIFTMGYFFYRLFLLLGFLGLIFIITHSKEHRWIPLTTFFVFMITFFSTFAYYVFYITSAVLLGYITYYLYKNWHGKKKNHRIPFLTFLSFLILFISAVTFIFVLLNIHFYVVAEVLQLAGFLILLVAYILLVFKK